MKDIEISKELHQFASDSYERIIRVGGDAPYGIPTIEDKTGENREPVQPRNEPMLT
jgi:hypothetical protein